MTARPRGLRVRASKRASGSGPAARLALQLPLHTSPALALALALTRLAAGPHPILLLHRRPFRLRSCCCHRRALFRRSCRSRCRLCLGRSGSRSSALCALRRRRRPRLAPQVDAALDVVGVGELVEEGKALHLKRIPHCQQVAVQRVCGRKRAGGRRALWLSSSGSRIRRCIREEKEGSRREGPYAPSSLWEQGCPGHSRSQPQTARLHLETHCPHSPAATAVPCLLLPSLVHAAPPLSPSPHPRCPALPRPAQSLPPCCTSPPHLRFALP